MEERTPKDKAHELLVVLAQAGQFKLRGHPDASNPDAYATAAQVDAAYLRLLHRGLVRMYSEEE